MFLRNPFKNRPITFKRLLQHFAVYTKQKKSSMTYLLNLLIRHQPDPMYDTLPHTGKQLLHKDGSDVPTFDIHLSLAEEIQCNISVPKTDESRPDNHVQADSEEENPSNTTLSQCQNVTTEQPAIVPRHQGKGKDHNRSHCLKLRLSTMEENICISVWKRLWPANLLVRFFRMQIFYNTLVCTTSHQT